MCAPQVCKPHSLTKTEPISYQLSETDDEGGDDEEEDPSYIATGPSSHAAGSCSDNDETDDKFVEGGEHEGPVASRKYIVDGEQLDQLFDHCRTCGGIVLAKRKTERASC